MHCAVENQLKYDVHDDPEGDQVAERGYSASSQFPAPGTEHQPDQVWLISSLGIGDASAYPQEDSTHGLQDEARSLRKKVRVSRSEIIVNGISKARVPPNPRSHQCEATITWIARKISHCSIDGQFFGQFRGWCNADQQNYCASRIKSNN
jgi:hypothetical protein